MKFLTVFLFLLTVNLTAQTVYKTPTGTKYHLSDCRMVKNVSSALSVEKALKEGFAPCKICEPLFERFLARFQSPRKHRDRIPSTVVSQPQKPEHGAREIQVSATISVSSIYRNRFRILRSECDIIS
ncbi:methylphosphotriester-DNA--protein-cysteine methyltransferase [Chryseobacterium sp. HSC-36S06]|nr:methylphosphotriester-DNA--protein-cysteine methyltransferase [Chryseobacterium sp. HSC-36S06]